MYIYTFPEQKTVRICIACEHSFQVLIGWQHEFRIVDWSQYFTIRSSDELRILVAFEKRKIRSMNILDEILCIDEEEIDYEQERVEELQYENLSDKGKSTPIQTEASLTTSNSPAQKPSSASNDGFLSFHKFLFSKPCQLFVVGGTNMFGKLEFLQCLEPVSYNGSTIDRPARTVLRPGDEVFVCSSRRTVACEKSLIIFGFFPWDRKNPDRGSVLVVNPGVVPRDASNVQTIFRVCPIKFVGLVPGGKHINEAGGLLREVEPLCRQLFNEFANSDQINPLSPLDLTTKRKSLFLPKTSTSNERPKRKQVPKGGAKSAPLKILPAKLKRISPMWSPVAHMVPLLLKNICQVDWDFVTRKK